ncbi:type III-B CRISPR module RAMP protein Cmr1 [Sulfurisphaera javensis]|uniref:Type III-B CRISPR module RAMP protein Cmr1 n=1 Tax=Sulfurisphaera javensis TaxID=2049879 RepID=A0AAT9GUW8_9CREN
MDEVATFTLRIYFPVYGGFDGTPINLDLGVAEPPRPTEFKYLWRWWYRVMLKDSANNADYTQLNKEVGEILGNEGKASNYVIRVEEFEVPNNVNSLMQEVNNVVNFFVKFSEELYQPAKRLRIRSRRGSINLISFLEGDYRRIISHRRIINRINEFMRREDVKPLWESVENLSRKIKLAENTRLRLILLTREDEADEIITINNGKLCFPLLNEENREAFRRYVKRLLSQLFYIDENNNNIRIKLKVYARNKCEEKDLIPLIVGMVFDGIGANSSRGFGSIVIEEIESNCISQELIDIVETIFTATSKANLEKGINVLLSCISKKYSQYFALPDMQTVEPTKVPSFQSFGYEAIQCRGRGINCLEKIWKAVLKSEWKKLIRYSDTNCYDNKEKIRCWGGNLHTEVLGLPRSQRNLGYLPNYRRRSYIGFKLIGNIVLIHWFYSLDFPLDLQWLGEYDKRLVKNLAMLEPGQVSYCHHICEERMSMNEAEYIKNGVNNALEEFYKVSG